MTQEAAPAPRLPRLLRAMSGISLAVSLGAVVAALATMALLLTLSGSNPGAALKGIANGSLTSTYALSVTVSKTVPRLFAALGIAVALRAGLYNIGAEGQIYVGGIAAAAVAVESHLSGPGALALALIAGLLAGALWGAIPGILRAKRGVSEVITSLMLVYIGIHLTNYLLEGPWLVPGSTFPATAPVPADTQLPQLMNGTVFNTGAIIALAAVPFTAFLMRRTVFGLRLNALGGNPSAAKAAGTHVARTIILAMAVSGAFAGLAGAVEVVGVRGQLLEGFSTNYGFDAIAIALLGRLNPVGILAAALLFGALDAGGTGLQAVSGPALPNGIVPTVEGLTMVYVLIGLGISWLIQRRRRASSALSASAASSKARVQPVAEQEVALDG